MIDIEELERLAKAAQTDIPGHRIKFFVQMDPEIALSLIGEVRQLREDLQAAKLLAHANGEMFRAEEEEAAKLHVALQKIAAIENKMVGGDWDEIEEARDIANKALYS